MSQSSSDQSQHDEASSVAYHVNNLPNLPNLPQLAVGYCEKDHIITVASKTFSYTFTTYVSSLDPFERSIDLDNKRIFELVAHKFKLTRLAKFVTERRSSIMAKAEASRDMEYCEMTKKFCSELEVLEGKAEASESELMAIRLRTCYLNPLQGGESHRSSG
ncbi:MAG: hypothetical protein Q9221_004762 [Calogaya cf. arnoldii]